MKAKGVIAVLVVVGLLVFVAVSVLGGSKDKAASIRTIDTKEGGVFGQVNYQGYLVNSSDSSAVTDTLEMIFELYDVETGGSPLWSETHESVVVRKGFFAVPLGNVNSIPDHLLTGQSLWLQSVINGEELGPRRELLNPRDPWLGDPECRAFHYYACWTPSGEDCYFSKSGNVGIGTEEPAYKLHIKDGGARIYYWHTNDFDANLHVWNWNIFPPPSVATGTYGIRSYVSYDDSEKKYAIYGYAGGSGDTYAGYFVGEGYFSDNVGIGTTEPDEKFEVEWEPGVDVEIGRGTTDPDITFITLRSPNGTKWYIYPGDFGVLHTTTTHP